MTFIETIKLNNGVLFHLEYHQKRVAETFAIVFPKSPVLNLRKILQETYIPSEGFFKIRIEYNSFFYNIEFIPYEFRFISAFKIVQNDTISYPLKSSQRSAFQSLMKDFENQEIIIVKKGFVTDTSYSNLVFYKNLQWHTPTHFLLNGTCRQRLLAEKRIKEIPITPEDIFSFEKIGIINAMIDLEERSFDINFVNF